MKMLALAAMATLTCAGTAEAATVVYSNDFEAPATTGGGTSASLTTGGTVQSATGFPGAGSNFLRTDTTALTQLSLTNLPSHSTIDFDFLLAFIDSWDSYNGSPAPDNLDIYIDGTLVATLTAANASGSTNDFDGGTGTGAGNFGYSGWIDQTVDMSGSGIFSFAHSASSITFGLQASGNGWQGGWDESWAIDNITVTVDGGGPGAVPEPSTWAMMLLGFGAAGYSIRRGKRAQPACAAG